MKTRKLSNITFVCCRVPKADARVERQSDQFQINQIKMSIEYQLYTMSFTNHIIIPIVGSRQNLEEQNIFMPSFYTFTPQKDDNTQEMILWKKSMSAFKKFKDKKDRKDRKNNGQNDFSQNDLHQIKKQYVQLVIKKPKELHFNPLMKAGDRSESFGDYFDPNQAPLYEFDLNEPMQQLQQLNRVYVQSDRNKDQFQQIKIERIQSEYIEEELPYELIIEPRFDDPFIIVRKQSIKKNLKSNKIKLIKKNKVEKKKDRNTALEGTAKGDQGRSTNQGQIGVNPSAEAKGQNESDSDSSSSEKDNSDHFMRAKKEIHTLDQIMKKAHSKAIEENMKSGKQRQAILCLKLEEKLTMKTVQ